MQPDIIVYCAFTRAWAMDGWLNSLESLKLDPEHTSLAVIIDIDEPIILKKLQAFVYKHKWKKFVYKMNSDWHPNEVRIAIRRMRIADVKNQSKDIVGQCEGDYILSFEDDTIFEGLDWRRLIDPFDGGTYNRVGFVQGVQCGRWGVKMIGAWMVDDPINPTTAETVLPSETTLPGEDYDYITGGGWYGYATTRELYLNCEYYTSSAQPWGPDVNFGLWLQKRGYTSLIDWSSVFGHSDHNVVMYPDENITTIKFIKDITTGRWDRNDTDRTR